MKQKTFSCNLFIVYCSYPRHKPYTDVAGLKKAALSPVLVPSEDMISFSLPCN